MSITPEETVNPDAYDAVVAERDEALELVEILTARIGGAEHEARSYLALAHRCEDERNRAIVERDKAVKARDRADRLLYAVALDPDVELDDALAAFDEEVAAVAERITAIATERDELRERVAALENEVAHVRLVSRSRDLLAQADERQGQASGALPNELHVAKWRALDEAGLVAFDGGRYRLTAAGRQALEDWR